MRRRRREGRRAQRRRGESTEREKSFGCYLRPALSLPAGRQAFIRLHALCSKAGIHYYRKTTMIHQPPIQVSTLEYQRFKRPRLNSKPFPPLLVLSPTKA
jgi:hypothetical protein